LATIGGKAMKARSTMYPRTCEIYDSTNVVRIGYDPIDREMMITFGEDVKYIYPNVQPAVFADIVSSESVGKTLNVYIRKHNLTGTKVTN